MLFFILQRHSIFHSVLARILAKKQVICHYFHPSTPFVLSIFKNKTCILHHFAFLVWLPTRFFSTPISHFQLLKPHFLAAILPFLVMCYMAQKGFVYTITVDIYAFRPAFSSILPCVLHQNTLRFAPKRTTFSTKMHSFSTKMHYILRQIAPKMGQTAVS